MNETPQKESIVSPSDICHQAFSLMKLKDYSGAEMLVAGHMAKTEDPTALALYHSSLGVLCKIKKNYKAAFKHYERAEKFLPDDPALKIIMARLLIDPFAQYAQAIRRAQKVLEILPNNPVFVHQAYITMGLSYAKKGERKKSIQMLEKSWGNSFEGFVTSKNIDFSLLEVLLKKEWGLPLCGQFLSKALAFAKDKKEEDYVKVYQTMLDTFERTYKE